MNIIYKLEKSKDGLDILKIKYGDRECYLGSYYNQKREIDKLYRQFNDLKSNDIYILIGLGNGEHLREILKRKVSKNKILVIEHNKEWIKKFENNNLNLNEFIITSEEQEIKSFINKIPSNIVENIKFIGIFNYEKILVKECLKTMKMIKDQIVKLVLDRNTNMNFKENWFQSNISNLIYGNNAMEINNLKNKFKNTPAIIVSAGPSLSKNIKELKLCKKKALIITGGRTLRPLLENKITPNLLGVIDGSEASYQLVEENLNDVEIPLLFNQVTNKEIVKKHKGKKIVVSDNKLYEKLWAKKFPNIQAGGSVAHVITCAAIYLGCNPIIFVGQDLAYTDNKGHSEIAYNIKDENKSTDIKRYENETDIFVNDINGEKIKTSLSLNNFKISFEEIIKFFKNVKFINATEGGANIRGAENRKLIDIINELEEIPINDIDNLIVNNEKSIKLKNIIDELFKEFEGTNKICVNGIKELEKLKIAFKTNRNIKKILAELNEIDEKLKNNILALDFIKDYIYEDIYIIECEEKFTINEKDSEEKRFDKIYKKNKEIYRVVIKHLNNTKREISKTLIEYGERGC